MPDKLKPVISVLGKYKYVLLVIAVGLVLLAWPNAPPQAPVADDQAPQPDTQELEQKIQQALASVEGVGRVSVLLTLKQDMETQYVVDEDVRDKRQWADGSLQSYEQDKKTVVHQDSEQPLIKSRVYPVYKGALIICDGADDAGVRTRILESVSSLTGLGFDKISVVRMKPQEPPAQRD